jgi:hypothetical protein
MMAHAKGGACWRRLGSIVLPIEGGSDPGRIDIDAAGSAC